MQSLKKLFANNTARQSSSSSNSKGPVHAEDEDVEMDPEYAPKRALTTKVYKHDHIFTFEQSGMRSSLALHFIAMAPALDTVNRVSMPYLYFTLLSSMGVPEALPMHYLVGLPLQ